MAPDEPEEDEPEEAAPDETPSAADPASLKKQRVKKLNALQRRTLFWTRVLDDVEGRAAAWEMLREAGWNELRMGIGPNGFPQPEQTWMHYGEYRLADRLFRTWLKLYPAGTLLMLREHCPDWQDPKKPRRQT